MILTRRRIDSSALAQTFDIGVLKLPKRDLKSLKGNDYQGFVSFQLFPVGNKPHASLTEKFCRTSDY